MRWILKHFVSNANLISSDGIAIAGNGVSRVGDRTKDFPQSTVSPDCEQRCVEEGVVLSQIFFLLSSIY